MSVVKNGLPVPAAKTTMRFFSRWRMARRRMYGSATYGDVERREHARRRPAALEGILQRDRVEHGRGATPQ